MYLCMCALWFDMIQLTLGCWIATMKNVHEGSIPGLLVSFCISLYASGEQTLTTFWWSLQVKAIKGQFPPSWRKLRYL